MSIREQLDQTERLLKGGTFEELQAAHQQVHRLTTLLFDSLKLRQEAAVTFVARGRVIPEEVAALPLAELLALSVRAFRLEARLFDAWNFPA